MHNNGFMTDTFLSDNLYNKHSYNFRALPEQITQRSGKSYNYELRFTNSLTSTMKFVIVFLAFVACVLAVPAPVAKERVLGKINVSPYFTSFCSRIWQFSHFPNLKFDFLISCSFTLFNLSSFITKRIAC